MVYKNKFTFVIKFFFVLFRECISFLFLQVPLRRIDQRFVQPTSIHLPLPEGFKVPGHIDDAWFKKKGGTKSQVTTKATEAMVKSVKKTKAKPNLSRKKAQRFVDEAVMKSFKKHDDKMVFK